MLQVHDELCFSIDADESGNPNEEITGIMENCVDAKVPFKVDCAIADNWGASRLKYEIIDNAYSAQDRENMFTFVRNSKYVLGWADQHWDDVNGQRRILYSHYSLKTLRTWACFDCTTIPE